MGRRATRRERAQRRTAFLILAGIAIVIGGGVYGMQLIKPADYDPSTLCVYADVSPPHTAVVIDKTDEYSRTEADLIAQAIRRKRDQLEVGERFTLFELDARGEFNPRGEFSLCNPGRGDQVNPIIRNPRLIEEKYEELFDRPFETVLSDLVTPKEAPASPILEALARLSQTEAFSRDVDGRSVLLVSDMLQNSSLFSAYGGRGSLPSRIDDPGDVADAVVAKHGSGLRGVDLEIRLIPRDGFSDLQRGALREYWDDVFSDLGVRAPLARLIADRSRTPRPNLPPR